MVDALTLNVERAFLVAPSNAEDLRLGQPAVSRNGKYLYVPYYFTDSADGTQVGMFDVATGKIVGSPITVGRRPFFCCMAPNGRTLYVSNYFGSSVTVVDTAP